MYFADNGDTRWSGTGTVAANGVSFTDNSSADFASKGASTTLDMIYLTDSSGNAYTSKMTSVVTTTITLTTSMVAGTYTYFIMRAPKYYDPLNPPSSAALPLATATAGYMPVGCPLCCTYKNRWILAGYPRHIFYASSQLDPLNFDFGADPADPTRAWGGLQVGNGTSGFPITALIPFSDDYLIFGCESAIFILRGDLTTGGSIDTLSRTVGVLGGKSWAKTPDGFLVFLSRNGVWVIPPGGGEPQPFSKDVIPKELMDIDTSTYEVSMCYDTRYRGIHIYKTQKASGDTGAVLDPADPLWPTGLPTTQNNHWFLDWANKGFWPEGYHSNYSPLACLDYHNTTASNDTVLLGSRNGYLYKYSDTAYRDDSTADSPTPFVSNLVLGPFQIGDGYSDGMLRELVATMSDDTGTVTYEVFTANSPEACLTLANSTSYQGIKITADHGVVSGAGTTFQDAHVADFTAYLTSATDSVWLWASDGTPSKSVITTVALSSLTLTTAQTNGTYAYRAGTTTVAPYFDTLTAGLNYTDHPMIRGGAFVVKLTHYLGNETWAIDNITCIRESFEKLRKLS